MATAPFPDRLDLAAWELILLGAPPDLWTAVYEARWLLETHGLAGGGSGVGWAAPIGREGLGVTKAPLEGRERDLR